MNDTIVANDVRDLTLEEEIGMLVDPQLRERMLHKYYVEKEEEKILYNRLENCHTKIRKLERATQAQALLIGQLMICNDDTDCGMSITVLTADG